MNERLKTKTHMRNLAARLLHENSGQTIFMFSFALILVLATSGAVIDVGRAMVENGQIKTTTTAAALAGASDMPSSTFTTAAQTIASNNDVNQGLASAAVSISSSACTPSSGKPCLYVAGYCSTFVTDALGIGCADMGAAATPTNALVVTQSAYMPTTFMQLLGIKSMTFTDSETAAWKGKAGAPYNVAVVVDSTASMDDEDSGSDGCGSQAAIACALQGVQALLESTNLIPCQGTSGSCSGAVPEDEVALYTFPGLSNSTTAVTDDVTCAAALGSATGSYGGFGQADSTTYYGLPGAKFSTTSPFLPNPGPIYQIVGFSTDYKNAGSTTTLNSSSKLVEAVGGAGEANCSYNKASGSSGGGGGGFGGNGGGGSSSSSGSWAGIQAVGGAGTYYAGVIYQAQNDLYNQYESRLNPSSGTGEQTQNVMIILSDGDATSTGTDMGGYATCTGSGTSETCTPKTVTTSGAKLVANTNSSTALDDYPADTNLCQQAVTAAQAATNGTFPDSSGPKTTVYTVAYGSETTGCSEMPPCTTMQEMASSYLTDPDSPQMDFYSDYQASGTDVSADCTSSNPIPNLINPTTGAAESTLADIFTAIGNNLTVSKMMANNSTCAAGPGGISGTCD